MPDTAVLEQPQAEHKPFTPIINYTLAASMLAAGVDKEAVAQEVGAKNWESLRVGLHARGITITKLLRSTTSAVGRNPNVKGSLALNRDDAIRDMVKAHVREALTDPDFQALPLASKGQGRIDVLHKATQIAALAEDWGSDRIQTVVGVSITSHADAQDEPVVDVESVTEADNQGVQSPDSV